MSNATVTDFEIGAVLGRGLDTGLERRPAGASAGDGATDQLVL